MVRLFTAMLGTETNSFSPLPTGLGAYEDYILVRNGNYGKLAGAPFTGPLIRWREKGKALGWDVIEGTAAFASPAGNTTAACFNTLCGEILEQLKAAMPVDLVILNLHGAMVAENSLDAEGELLDTVAVVGLGEHVRHVRVERDELHARRQLRGKVLDAVVRIVDLCEHVRLRADDEQLQRRREAPGVHGASESGRARAARGRGLPPLQV